MKKSRFTLGAVCLTLLVCLLSGCAQQEKNLFLGRPDAYTRAFLKANPEYKIDQDFFAHNGNLFQAVSRGTPAQCLEIQTLPAISQGIGKQFQPQGLATVVFAVNRDLTALRPHTWEELADAGTSVGIPRTELALRGILGAAAYGLEGENYGKEQALTLYRSMAQAGNLRQEDGRCPISVCFDLDAAERIRRGENLTMIVPSDGTLSFVFGLYTDGSQPGLTDAQLLDAGIRLPDGRCENPAYPESEFYGPAVLLPDLPHFLEVTGEVSRDFTRTVFHSRILITADDRERVLAMTTAALLVILWAATALHRSAGLQMQHWILLLAGQMLGWLIIYLLKHQLYVDSGFSRLCWYGSYIFLMGLPLTVLYIGIAVDQHPLERRIPLWFRLLLLTDLLLTVLVFTNSHHRLMFRFPLSGHWTGSYDYGVGYYLMFGCCSLCCVLSLVILIRKSAHSPKRWSCVMPVAAALLLILYLTAYALRLPVILDSNFPLIFCLFSILYLEGILHAGLIPTNTRYRKLFSFSPLNMQLLDPEGNTVLRSAGAQELTALQRQRIVSQPETPFYQEPDILLHSQQIHGGFAIWQEDVKELNALQEQLLVSIQELKTTNAMLHKQGQIKREKVVSEIKNQLFDQLEQEIAPESQEISRVIQSLSQAPDRKKEISCLPLLLCHLKRKCNLFFLSREGGNMSSNELTVYLDELSEFASYAGVHALVRCGLSSPLPVDQGTACYDFYFSLIFWAFRRSNAVLIGKLESRNSELCFDVLSSQEGDDRMFDRRFLDSVGKASGTVEMRDIDDAQGICLIFPGRD